MFRRISAVFFIGIFVLLLVSCGPTTTTTQQPTTATDKKKEIKAAFVYVGPVGDAGWTYTHDQARKELEKQLPDVKTTYIESVKEGADAERVLVQFAQKGYDVVFATSFGYMDYCVNASERFPKTVFMHCSGYKTTKNLGTYFGRMYQARYLSGLVAGKMTKSNIIGYVAAHPIPEVIRGINAFTIGARSVNPKVKVHVVWTHTWYDPATEKDAAKSLLDIGADVIAQHQDTPAPQQAAQEKGVYSIGYNCDMSSFAPKAHMVAPVWNWAPYYASVVKAVKDGTWKNDSYWGGLKDGVVGLSPFGPMVPQEVKDLVEKEKKRIISGQFDVFDGPVNDQDGKEKIAKGVRPEDKLLLNMSWFVEGVIGKASK